MWNPPTVKQLAAMPGYRKQDGKGLKNQVIHMHFFIGGSDWYAAEYDPETGTFFGFTILNGDMEMAEWGEFSLEEMLSVKIFPGVEIDRDLHWEVRRAEEVDKIAEAQGWR